MPVPVYAVVPSYGRDCLKLCLDSLVDQADLIFLIQTHPFDIRPHLNLIRLPWDGSRELNISQWWNMGIKAAATTAEAGGHPEWDVLVTNDDIIAPPGLTAGLSAGMRAGTSALAYCTPANWHHITPITGWCFMLRGEAGIMADEQFRWWYGDNDIELQARARGGAVAVEGCSVRHLFPTGHDHLMGEQTKADTERYHKKWDR